MAFTPDQITVLDYLQDQGWATRNQIARDTELLPRQVSLALTGLASKRMVVKDNMDFQEVWIVAPKGEKVRLF